jgi:hypothetical protein
MKETADAILQTRPSRSATTRWAGLSARQLGPGAVLARGRLFDFQIALAAHLIDMPSQIATRGPCRFPDGAGLSAAGLCQADGARAADAGAGLLGIAVAAYQWVEYVPLMMRAGDPRRRHLVGVRR